MKSFEEGQAVNLIQPTISGVVADTRYNKDAKELEHLVEYTDAGGEVHSRWFMASQLEAVK